MPRLRLLPRAGLLHVIRRGQEGTGAGFEPATHRRPNMTESRVLDFAPPAGRIGAYRADRDGSRAGGELVASGIYFCRLEAGRSATRRKLAAVQ